MQNRTIAGRGKGWRMTHILARLACALTLLIALPAGAGEMTQVPGLMRAPLPVVITPAAGSPVTLEAARRALANCAKNAPDCYLYAFGNERAH
jgi:hypothetical protein